MMLSRANAWIKLNVSWKYSIIGSIKIVETESNITPLDLNLAITPMSWDGTIIKEIKEEENLYYLRTLYA